MQSTRISPSASLLIVALLVTGYVFFLAINWPGHLSYDSVIQLYEGRFGAYSNWHPPFMSWLLGLADAAVSGSGLFIAFDLALVFGSFALMFVIKERASYCAALVLLAILLSPQLLLYQGIVWKDVLFADVSFAGFVGLAAAAHYRHHTQLRRIFFAVAFGFFTLGALSRQNGVLVLGAGAVTAALLVFVQTRDATKSILLAGTGLLSAVIMVAVANQALSLRYVGSSGPDRQFTLLQLYDLTGAVRRAPSLPLSALEHHAPEFAKLVRTDGARLFTPSRSDTLAKSQALQDRLVDTPPEYVRAQWLDLIQHHARLYLGVRADIFRWVFFTPEIERCVPFAVGLAGPQEPMTALGLIERKDARDVALWMYGNAFLHTPVFSHALFAGIAAGIAGFLLWRRKPEDIAIAGLQLSALLFTASFFVISIACDYRYLYFLDLSALAGLFYVALDSRIKA